MSPLPILAISGAGFVLSHLVLSHPPVRQPLVDRLGEMNFKGVYSLAVLVFFVPLGVTWYRNIHAGDVLWVFRSPAVAHPMMGVALLAYGLVGMGVLSPSPTSMTGPASLEPTGAAALTRHPVNVGIAMWAATHMALNGWVGDLIFFGSMLALAVLGSLHQDHRNRVLRPGYDAFVAQTTWLPVPSPARLSRVGLRAWVGFVLGAVGGLAFYLGHGALFR